MADISTSSRQEGPGRSGAGCAICGESSGALRCSNCHKVSYCSKEHQKHDWKRHKKVCFPVEVRQDSARGRFLVATRLIAAGEVFLKEKPLICGPKRTRSNIDNDTRICLSCFQPARSAYRCTKCLWPVCNESCEQAPVHSRFECPVFTRKRVLPTFTWLDNMCVTTLRGLLLKKLVREKWKQLLQLEAHEERRKLDLVDASLTASVIKYLHHKCDLEQEFDEDTIAKVVGAIRINAIGSSDELTSNPNLICRCSKYLYLYGSMAMHSCTPNIQRIIQLDSSLNFVALVPIQPEEPICYVYADIMNWTMERRAHLESHYYFSCNCDRCSDPTECGTNFSSVTCKNCKDKGHLLPINPLDSESEWKCGVCNLRKSGGEVRELIQRIKDEIDAVPYADSVNSLENLESLLRKYQGAALHPNHGLMVATEYEILQRIDYLLQSRAVSDRPSRITLSKRQIELCRKCLRISEAVYPGCSEHRGCLLYFFQNGVLNYILARGRVECTHEKREQKELWEEMMKSRKEGSDIFRRFPAGSKQREHAKAMVEGNEVLVELRAKMG